MTRPGIGPRSPRPLANTTIRPVAGFDQSLISLNSRKKRKRKKNDKSPIVNFFVSIILCIISLHFIDLESFVMQNNYYLSLINLKVKTSWSETFQKNELGVEYLKKN